jgi:hypothetical protein
MFSTILVDKIRRPKIYHRKGNVKTLDKILCEKWKKKMLGTHNGALSLGVSISPKFLC